MSSFVIYLVFFTINILIFLRQFSFQICSSFKLARKETKATLVVLGLLVFISYTFISNAKLKLAKNQTNAKEHAEAEF